MSRAQTRREWRSRLRGESARPPVLSEHRETGLLARHVSRPPHIHRRAFSHVYVQIEELALKGLQRTDVDRIAAALGSELRGILMTKGLPQSWTSSWSYELGETTSARLTSRASAQWIGSQAALAIYRLGGAGKR